jgi:hypothetical protein
MSAGELSPASASRARFTRVTWLMAVLAFGLFSPMLALPLREDDFPTLYWARASSLDPHWLFYSWYGGVFGRLIPKLLLMLGMSVAGPRHEVFELVNLLLQVANVLLIERLVRAWTGSRRTALTAALLFAVGFGFYGKAVMKISNLSMNLGLTLALWAFLEWQARRRGRALLLWLATLATHEITALAPLVMLFTPASGLPAKPAAERWRTGAALGGLAAMVLALAWRGAIGRTAVCLASYVGFALFPVNVAPAADLPVAGLALPRGLLGFLAAHRLVVGLALLPAVAFALTRGAVARLAVVWMFLMWLPAAVLMSNWSGSRFDARYLMAPAVGVCLLSALALDRIPARRLRVLLLTGLVAWSLVLTSCTWLVAWEHVRHGARWRQIHREFGPQLVLLERTHVPTWYPAGQAPHPIWRGPAAPDRH